jgi:SAM-dependent methyltransferase
MLGVPVEHALGRISGGFDAFFSSHVLEHLNSPRKAIRLACQLLKPGGLFLAFTPNGSLVRAGSLQHGHAYRSSWGLVHPTLPDEVFYSAEFAGHPMLCCSDPYDLNAFKSWNQAESRVCNVGGAELMVAVRLKDPQHYHR